MKSFKCKLNIISNDANRELVSIGISTDGDEAKVTFKSNSLKKKTEISSSDFPKIDISILTRKPKVKKSEKKVNNIVYRKKDNTILTKYKDKEDIDILAINNVIKNILSSDSINIKKLRKKEDDIRLRMDQPLSIIQRKTIERQYFKLKSTIDNITDREEEYISQVKDILKNYQTSVDTDDRISLINRYLKVTKKYVNYDLYIQHKDYNICIGCNRSLHGCVWFNNGLVCPTCDVVNVCHNRMLDKDKIPTQNIKGHKRKESTFIERLYEFVCINEVDMPNDLIDKLDKYFKHKYPQFVSNKIKNINLVPDGDTKYIRGNTSVKLMTEALERCNFTKMYSHVRYICKLYWNWEMTDYSDKKNDIMVRYRISSVIYNKIKKGSSNLKADFHLYKIFKSMGINCSLNDFKPIKGDKTLGTYEDYWFKIEIMILENREYQYHHNELIYWNIDIKKVLKRKEMEYKLIPGFNGNVYDEYRHIAKI